VTGPLVLPITESSQAGAARRLATAMAGRLGFNETERGKVALVATEIAANIVAHTSGGELLLRPLLGEPTGIELLALDKGPGMQNMGECLRDGYSTAGTPGKGLGAVRRLAGQFDLYSAPGRGTALLARLWSAARWKPPPAVGLQLGVVCLPLVGEEVCGDAWAARLGPGRSLIMVADGLGHGLLAAEASRAAIQVFEADGRHGPRPLIERAHVALQGTRGAAVAVAEVDLEGRMLRFAGIGNIAGTVITDEGSRGLVSHNGTVGHQFHKIQEFEYAWPPGALLVLHSDGLETKWRLDPYPGLAARDPSLIAGMLYRDFTRGRDDVTVLVARDAARAGPVP
jgi:anti-sigma regulatory factor (Ser/Thr protein kinase)